MRFTDDDYRFVYWGSSRSSTGLHSDVLNSFSWSYNVAGEKLWTFYPPSADFEYCDNDLENSIKVQVTQHGGECIFVPAGWRHTVLNTKEAISINHNWTSSCALDCMWDCIQLEIKAVQNELREWGIDDTVGFNEKELMLSGCVGMNVSSFFFMLLVESIELIEKLMGVDPVGLDNNELWEDCFSLCCISQILEAVTGLDKTDRIYGIQTTRIDDFDERLSATLSSRCLAKRALATAAGVIQVIEEFTL